jgi:hypothetical protein
MRETASGRRLARVTHLFSELTAAAPSAVSRQDFQRISAGGTPIPSYLLYLRYANRNCACASDMVLGGESEIDGQTVAVRGRYFTVLDMSSGGKSR